MVRLNRVTQAPVYDAINFSPHSNKAKKNELLTENETEILALWKFDIENTVDSHMEYNNVVWTGIKL